MIHQPEWKTFAELLVARARQLPDQEAFVFLSEERHGSNRAMTYRQLDSRARTIGALLERAGCWGKPVLLLYPPGADFIAALFGCFYAGALAVPTYLPDPMRLKQSAQRLLTIMQDCGSVAALTTTAICSLADSILAQSHGSPSIHWILTDHALACQESADWEPIEPPDSLAVLQYTSGATAKPRGVMLSHSNLLHNSAFIHRSFLHSRECRGVIWLPPFHDMGLVGGILQPIYGAFPCALMAPGTFLRWPIRWLRAISEYRATTSGGPNFAYDLCVKRIQPQHCEELDLSSWKVAFNGAEPVRPETMDAFVQRFAPCGFRREAFFPCYGLAEATLQVTGSRKGQGPIVRAFSSTKLEQNAVQPATPGDRTTILVSCGRPAPDQQLAIVDPETLEPLPPTHVGEICVAGPSVAQGYWNRPEETRATFQSVLSGSLAQSFLRTGDLGFVHEGELFVAGRLKDLLLVRGRNYYPQEIEAATESGHEALRSNCSVAFTIPKDGTESLVVVCGVTNTRPRTEYPAIIRAIRQRIAIEADLQVHTIVLVTPGSIPKTPTGKVQRSFCRSLFLNRQLDVVATWSLGQGEEVSV